MYNQFGTSVGFTTECSELGSHTLLRYRPYQHMSITDITTQATEQNSIMNNLLEQVTGRLSPNAKHVQSSLDLGEVFTLLKNPRRRAIIRQLSEVEDGIHISELAERIAAAEEDTDRSDLSADARRRVYIACYQVHLPKLEEHEVVSMDDKKVITPSGNHSALVAVLNRTSAMIQ